jgi:AraC-like DNA-binding protein
MSITEIAFEVGFTPPNLRDQFKRHYGMTPTKYRTHLA